MGGEGGDTWKLNDHKQETSALLSQKLKGHPVNWDAVKRNAVLRRGIKLPKETKDKISKTLKEKISSGELIPHPVPHFDRTGSHHTEESRAAMSEARKGKTYEELYGEKAKAQRELRRKCWIGANNPNYKEVNIEEVVRLIQNGFSNQEVAKMLGISTQTIWSKLKQAGLSATQIRKELQLSEKNNV